MKNHKIGFLQSYCKKLTSPVLAHDFRGYRALRNGILSLSFLFATEIFAQPTVTNITSSSSDGAYKAGDVIASRRQLIVSEILDLDLMVEVDINYEMPPVEGA